nr:PAS domain S-box protein [Candidatus Bipolaricaulota bacterium]
MSLSGPHRVALLPIHSVRQREVVELLSEPGFVIEEFAKLERLFDADRVQPFDLIVVDARGGGLQILRRLCRGVPGERTLAMVQSSTAGFQASDLGAYISYARTAVELRRDVRHFLGETAIMAIASRDNRLVERSPFGVFEIRDGKIAYANDSFAVMLGRSREQLVGLPAKALITGNDLPRIAARLEAPPNRARGRSTLCELRHRDGSAVFADVRAEWVRDDGRMCLVGTARDITVERRLARLYEIAVGLGESILSEKDIDTILQRVLDAITESAGFQRAIVALYDLANESPFEGRVYKVLGSGLTPDELAEVRAVDPMPPEERVLAFQDMYRLGNAYYIPYDQAPWTNYSGLSGTVSIDDKWNKDDFLFIPLRGEAGIIGHISVDDPLDGSAPTAESIEPVAALANFAALAVERMYKIHQLRKQKERLRGLSMLPQRLMRSDDIGEVCSEAARQLRDDMEYDLCCILLRDGPFLEVSGFAAAPGLLADNELPGVGYRVPLEGEGRCRHAVRSGEIVSCADTRAGPHYREKELGMLSEIAVPIP